MLGRRIDRRQMFRQVQPCVSDHGELVIARLRVVRCAGIEPVMLPDHEMLVTPFAKERQWHHMAVIRPFVDDGRNAAHAALRMAETLAWSEANSSLNRATSPARFLM